ncbi:MAG: FAD:protein FMN transferase [Candidatus Izemoplasmatales bacterium]|nr:FAD:protein FMN transferase [Candidatus Izemoplasmatales bacterium]
MKKRFFVVLLSLLIWGLIGCNGLTTTSEVTSSLTNPNDEYCSLNSSTGVYVCTKSWISYFNTTISLTLYYPQTPAYDVLAVYDTVENTLQHYHDLFDKYNAYANIENVFTINRDSNIPSDNYYGTKTIDEDLFTALQYALDVESDIVSSNGLLFNIAISPISSLWHDARESFACTTSEYNYSVCPLPSEVVLDASYNIDPDDIILDETNLSIRFAKPGMGLDLGGFGKGYTAEVISDLLDAQNIIYILNSGNSNIKAGGINPNRQDGSFYIALTKPSLTSSYFSSYYAYLKIMAGMSVVTSGSYQNFFIGQTDNIVYHHIINPTTHRPGGNQITLSIDDENNIIITPSNALLSVTIICENGAMGDIYSTALFLMSYQDGLAFVEATGGLEAIWYCADGSFYQSSGLNESQIEVSSGVYKPLITIE